MNKKKLHDCKYFYLDSGVLIDLLKVDLSACEDSVKKRVEFTHRFFNTLNDPDTFGVNKKVYQLSAVSLAEIFHVDNVHESAIRAIASALDSQDVEILSFDFDAALFHNKEFYKFLSNKEIDKIKSDVNYPQSQYSSIKDRIRKDIMIATTAKMYNSDVVLTNDSGFQSLCERLDISCHLFTDKENQFICSQGTNLIYDFNYEKRKDGIKNEKQEATQ